MTLARQSAGSIAAADVSIVVPVGGVARAWPGTAASLARLDPPPGEIVVVIDGADDRLAATGAAIGATVLTLAHRGGPARARNRGALGARGAVLLFLDADVETPPQLVAHVARLFTAHPDVAAVIGSYDDAPGGAGFVSHYRNLLHHYVHQTAREQASTFWAGCGAVRREAFEAVGGFDERFVDPSIEDIELGSRMVRSGYAIRLAKELQVRHQKVWRVGDMVATDLWHRAVPWTELMLRDGALVNDLNVKSRDRASVALAVLSLIALVTSPKLPLALVVSAASLAVLLVINRGLLGFFARRRGMLFALGSIPLFWLYLLVCGVGFAIGVARHVLTRRETR